MRSSISAQSCASVPPAAGLDIEERIVRGIHLAGEHAAELELGQALIESVQIAGDLRGGVGVILFRGEFQQLTGIGESRIQRLDGFHHLGQLRPLLAQGLGPLRIVPELRVLELPGYLFQPVLAIGVVKGTP